LFQRLGFDEGITLRFFFVRGLGQGRGKAGRRFRGVLFVVRHLPAFFFLVCDSWLV
jgi:hypothetical protein